MIVLTETSTEEVKIMIIITQLTLSLIYLEQSSHPMENMNHHVTSKLMSNRLVLNQPDSSLRMVPRSHLPH